MSFIKFWGLNTYILIKQDFFLLQMWSTCFTHDYLRYNIFHLLNCSCLSSPKTTLAQKGQGWKGDMGEEDQKVWIFRYKISKSLGCNIQYNMYS